MSALADFLAFRREDLFQRFERTSRERRPPAEGLSRSAIIDTLPQLLDEIQESLRNMEVHLRNPSEPCHSTTTAEEHGTQRWSLGYDISQLIGEYGLLRECLFELLEEAGVAPELTEHRVLHRCIDLAMSESAAAHKRQRDEEHLRLEETLALLDTLLATAPVGLSFMDRELRYVRINHALAEINGVPVEQTLGRTPREVLPELAPHLEPYYRRVLETGEPVLNVDVVGTTPGLRGGTGSWLVSFYPVKDREGHPFMVGTVVVDITERKQHEEHLRQTAEFRERFLGLVSHDLRTPLGTISLSANHLLRREPLSERALRAVQRIANSAELMARMIGDLLDLTRGRLGGGIPLVLVPANLHLLGRRVVGEMEVTYPSRELRLEAEGDLGGVWDPDRLSQLMSNLLKNALEYSPAGTPVTLSLVDEGEQVRLAVRNLGEPISAELLPVLFEPFRRGVGRTGSGLGLGLYIVQQLALAHGGTLDVRSTREEGTVFTLRLPRVAPSSPGGPASA